MTKYVPRRALIEDEVTPEPSTTRAVADSVSDTAPGAAASNAPVASSTPHGGYLSHRQILVVMGGLMAGMFLAALDQSIVGVALPKITSDLGRAGQAVLGRHRVPADLDRRHPAVGQDLRPARPPPIFQAAIVVFLIGSLICGFARRDRDLVGTSPAST